MRCLSLDLEVGKRSERIHALAAVWQDGGEGWSRTRVSKARLAPCLEEIDQFAAGADCLLGHNLIRFDIPHLRAVAPDLRLLHLPVVDTLWLSPLAFPANPYHHLVKHDHHAGLVRGQRNDPLEDARNALGLFDDERRALSRGDPDLLAAWHWLVARTMPLPEEQGFDRVFTEVRGCQRPSDAEAMVALDRLLDGNACATAKRAATGAKPEEGWPLAYALAWLSVAGGNSVMPPWVRHQFPEAGRLVRRLRDVACQSPDCAWCRERHDAGKELRRWFDFTDYRSEPATKEGGSMQQAIVETNLAGRHVLGLLPTGAGKSLCYQVPALSRHDRIGALTVVISPLVALMADQVTGMEKRGIASCVTVNGLLSMPERADALQRVRLGDAAIVLVSPEQLRNRSFRHALAQREIGAWVVDEAHCLSRWGHDFRPDYRYIGRFIRESAGESAAPPPIMCLTATAKPDVVRDICSYFREQLDTELAVFNGGAERDNLEFEVMQTDAARKDDDIHAVLDARLASDAPGGAIVYCATRRRTEEVAEFLSRKGLVAAHFHAGLAPETKKDTQQRFIDGELKVIVATNAFGMGIDKPDVRLVVHADIPGSLENYLQEAGRAGRDRKPARCVLLYTPEDVERQFGMSARSRLTRREIHGILRALRNIDRHGRLGGEVTATPGEILLEDDEGAFERDSATDDTRVRTAIAWLEEATLLARNENDVRVFPSSLRVESVEEAQRRLAARRNLTQARGRELLAIVRVLMASDPDEGVSTDELMVRAGIGPDAVRAALHDLESLGIAANDTALTAFVHVAVQRSSARRFQEACDLEQALLEHMRELAPEMEVGDASDLHLRTASQTLRNEGKSAGLPERLNRILRSISQDGRGDDRAEGGSGGSIDLRQRDRESVRITLRRRWRALIRTADVRRNAAGLLLNHLLARVPDQRGTDLLAETTLGQLRKELANDIHLGNDKKRDLGKLMDRSLLWLHEQEVIRLNRGLAVFRPAMTIQLEDAPGSRRRGFRSADFEPLALHYREQVLQVHIMAEFATRGLAAMAEALRLAMDYFSLEQQTFVDRWLPRRQAETKRETTAETWRAVVEALSPMQRSIVVDDREQSNTLVLAGPGAGKTRVLVHRIAYLLRVRRENPRGIVALAYNRHAATQIRRRLTEMVGDDARGVTVLTCHAMAMRLVGASFSNLTNAGAAVGEGQLFDEVLRRAVALLRGDGLPPEDADEQRDRLLAGFRWILVDEYQDIDPVQYDLISALAGRTLGDDDRKLSLFAVGDDDQNIYSFNGASVEFIRRFGTDYRARDAWLTENYRSTAHIIDAANAFIAPARERMKADHPIEVDRARRGELPGGAWQSLDAVGEGRVQVLPGGVDSVTQAQAAIAELRRLARLAGDDWNWHTAAVIARHWRSLDPVFALCERERIPVQLARDPSYFWRLREVGQLREWLEERPRRLVDVAALESWLDGQRPGPWMLVLGEAVADFRAETGDGEVGVEAFVEWLAEWGRELRRRQRGLLLVTGHGAKGLEFEHVVVLDDDWRSSGPGEDPDAWRRLYYVAMTRAKSTLALMRRSVQVVADGVREARLQPVPRVPELRGLPSVLQRSPVVLPAPSAELRQRRERLGLADVHLGFAGRLPSYASVHRAIARLQPGDPLTLRKERQRWELATADGIHVGRLAQAYRPKGTPIAARVHAVVWWRREDGEETREGQPERWEVVVPELWFEEDGT